MCSASTAYRPLVEPGLKAGNWAVFPGGGGGVGIQLAKALGLRPIAVDTGAAKRDLALEMGAEAFVDFKEVLNATAEAIKIADGKEAHGVFVTAPAAYSNAISYTGKKGRCDRYVHWLCLGWDYDYWDRSEFVLLQELDYKGDTSRQHEGYGHCAGVCEEGAIASNM